MREAIPALLSLVLMYAPYPLCAIPQKESGRRILYHISPIFVHPAHSLRENVTEHGTLPSNENVPEGSGKNADRRADDGE